MPKRTRDHHAWLLEQLSDPTIAADYLNEARRDSQKIFLKALRNVAEARRMAVVAQEAGVNRETLYRTLSEDGNPRLETYNSVLDALGLEYEFRPKMVAVAPLEPPEPATESIVSFSQTIVPDQGNTKLSATADQWNSIFNGLGTVSMIAKVPVRLSSSTNTGIYIPLGLIAQAQRTNQQSAT